MSENSSSLPPIPPGVRRRVELALQTLRRWNAAVEQARRMEAVARQPGRYEYDLRCTGAGATQRQQLEAALRTLAEFERLAPGNGVDAQAVYAQLGGRPDLLEKGVHVHAWRPSTAEETAQ